MEYMGDLGKDIEGDESIGGWRRFIEWLIVKIGRICGIQSGLVYYHSNIATNETIYVITWQ